MYVHIQGLFNLKNLGNEKEPEKNWKDGQNHKKN